MAYFPMTINLELSEAAAKEFIKENIDGFLEFVFLVNPFTVNNYLDDNMDELTEFVLSGGAG